MKKQTPKNSTNLRQIEGGKTIKQNDRSSNFVYKLLDEYGEIIPTLEGKRATIALVSDLEGGELKTAYETTATVEEGQVEFSITETLEPGKYFVEVLCKGYIFPSANTVTIEVTESIFSKQEQIPEVEESDQILEEEVEIDFDEEIIEDSSLFAGEERIEQEGEKGLVRKIWKNDLLFSEEVIKNPINRVIRKGTRLHEHTAYANISKGENVAQADFFSNILGEGMSKELVDGKQLITSSSLHAAVAYSTLDNVAAGEYEILIKVRKTSDEITNVRFGLENLGQMQEFIDISDVAIEYRFVVTVDKDYSALYYHFRTNASVELESILIRKVNISDFSWEDSGQSHVGVAYSKEETIPLEYSRFEWKEKE